MANNIFQAKRTNVSGRQPNTTGSYVTNSQYIAAGEFALNMADGILYSSNGSAVITVGANQVNQRITNSITIDNDKNLYWKTVNSSATVGLRQQNDDNFVFYSTNTSYGARAVYSIYANSDTSAFSFQVPITFNANVTKLPANGSTGSAGYVLTANGSGGIYWSSPGAASVDVTAQYNWTNLHTFSANVSFTGNGIGIATNTGAIYLGGISDANWKIGRNTNVVTKWRYTNNSIDIITANSNLEGMSIGLVNGNSYFETGYLGTFIASNVTIGNTSSNSTINSTAFSGTANNSTNLNGQPASYYTNATNISTGTLPYAQIPANIVNTTGSFTLSGNTTLAGTNTAISSNVNITGTFLNVASSFVVNSTGAYHTGTINAASHTVGTSTIANSTGVYTGIVNATTHSSGATFTANATLVNAAAINITGQTNTATLFVTTSANVGTAVIANSIGVTTTGFVNAVSVVNSASHTVGTSFVANSTGVYHTGTMNAAVLSTGTSFVANSIQVTLNLPLSANGSNGTSGYVLTSNGDTGSPYWTTAGGGVYMKGGASTIGSLAVEGQNIFRVNANTMNYDATIVSGENAQATGPLAIALGKTLTVQTGARVSIV